MKAERAKIFAPFAALKGHDALLREKEKVKVEKKILADDRISEIDAVLRVLGRGDGVAVEYYTGDGYVKKGGVVERVGKDSLTFDGKTVRFCDIYDVKKY